MALLIWTENLTGWAALSEWLPENPWPFVMLGVAVGLMVGLLFGTTSIGTGSLLVLLLTIFLALPEVRVVGSAILYGFVISLFAGVIHVALGNVIWGLVMLLLAGALPGVMLGSELAVRAPHRLLRTAFSVGAVLAGLKLI